MEVKVLKSGDMEKMKELFLDVFSNDPWYDKWEDEKQLDAYMADLTGNNNSLSLALYDKNHQLIGCSLGYVFNWWEGREYFIKEFFISRNRQNQGAGSDFLRLMNHLLKEKEIKHVTLMTEKTVPAYRFYLKNEFRDLEESAYLVRRVAE